jgi:hypothetical protein
MTAMQPIQLIKAPAPDAPAPWPATNWLILAPILVLGTLAIAAVQVRHARLRRLSDSERAARRLASLLRLPSRFRLINRDLAAAHGSASPAALLLSDHATRQAAQRLNPRPGSAQSKVLNEWLAARGLA